MSLVTTPNRASPAKAPHRAAISDDFPDPTGPPTPIRRARSTRKQTLLLLQMDGGIELDRDRRGRRQRAVIRGDPAGCYGHCRRELGEPARSRGGVERQQLQRRRRDRRRIVVEREQRRLL